MLLTGKELKEFRLLLDLTAEEAGNLMYVTKQTILNVEQGKCTTKSTRYLMEICYKKYLNEQMIKLKEIKNAQ